MQCCVCMLKWDNKGNIFNHIRCSMCVLDKSLKLKKEKRNINYKQVKGTATCV